MQRVVKRETSRGVRYEATYRDPSGREHIKRFDLKRQADEFLAGQKTDMVRDQWVDPAGGRMLVRDFVGQWEKGRVDLRDTSRRRLRTVLNVHVLPTFGPQRLGQVEQAAVQAWVSDLSESLAPSTVSGIYARLNQVFEGAIDAGLLKTSPCRKINLPRQEKTEKRFLSVNEVDELVDCMRDEYKALVLLGCWGGLRIGEMAALQWDRLDFLRRTVSVVATADCGGGGWTSGPPKSASSRRSISLPRGVIEALGEHRARRRQGDMVFTAPLGGNLWVNNWREEHWGPAVERACLAPLRPHDMRHTAVALWIASGMNVKEVSSRAGHRSVSFTLDEYGHLFPNADDAAVGRLDTMFWAGAEQRSSGAEVVALHS